MDKNIVALATNRFEGRAKILQLYYIVANTPHNRFILRLIKYIGRLQNVLKIYQLFHAPDANALASRHYACKNKLEYNNRYYILCHKCSIFCDCTG